MSQGGGFLLVDLAIEHGDRVVAQGRAFNTGDDQFLHTRPLGSNNLKVSVMDPLDMDALLSISYDEMTIGRDTSGGFVSWSKRLVTLDAWVCSSKLKYKS